MNNYAKIGELIATSLFLVVGLVAAGWPARQIWLFVCSSKWPVCRGKVVHSEIEQDEDSRLFTLKVEYSFEVDGRNVTGTMMRFGFPPDDRSETRSEVEHRAADFQVGAEVPVLHHPKNPRICFLQRSLDPWVFFHLGFGLFVAAFSASALMDSLR